MFIKSIPAPNIGITARWAAAVRAKESGRPDRLFNDPWAAALAGREGEEWAARRNPGALAPLTLRTRYFDDFLRGITEGGPIRQIVLLAAGFDTRAYRLDWPEGTQVFELDQVGVLSHKQDVLESAGATTSCARHSVGVDLTAPWAGPLLAAGFDPTQESGWLVEGFLFYLANELIEYVIDEISSLSAAGSCLGFDIINQQVLTSSWTQSWVEMQADAGAAWIGTMDDPVGFLSERGWWASLSSPSDADKKHGRWPFPSMPPDMPGVPQHWFVTAQKT